MVKPNVFTGTKDKSIAFKVSSDSKNIIEKRAKDLGFTKTTDYILTLIDKDLKEGAQND